MNRTTREIVGKTKVRKTPERRSSSSTFFLLTNTKFHPYGMIYPRILQAPYWVGGASTILDEILDSDEEFKETLRDREPAWIVMGIEARNFPYDVDIYPDEVMHENIRELLRVGFLENKDVAGFLETPNAFTKSDRQLFARVLVVESEEAAKAFCDAVLRGERTLTGAGPGKDETFQQAIERVLAALPSGYEARRHGLTEISDTTRLAIARVLEPALNEEARKRPIASYDEKKELAKWINAELRRFGLAIKNPRSGKPCLLMGNPGGKPGFGRFLLEYTDDIGKRHHPLTSVTLPYLELVPDELTRVSYEGRVRRPG